ncbi:MAG: HEPN domain-containing protein [Anaerolineae bacterium]
MSVLSASARREARLYIRNAHEMLQVAALNLSEDFHGSAVNRAYYAIFYAANALLATQGLTRSKHSGVIAAFRERFVKTGLIEVEYSDLYGRVMENRHVSDYEIEVPVERQVAARALDDAQRFVERVEQFFQQEGWL